MAGIVVIDRPPIEICAKILQATRALKTLSIQLDDTGLDDDAPLPEVGEARASTRPAPAPRTGARTPLP
ncbi:hypothetical protein [Mesorhizobium mediterraneum]|uniref:hypothetical protein n=1 Tax=Mesorhizobium mediterraneum TaxID=43617 RepID=UPI00177AD748|nr:hypothetical protein [Mesorhizobium mediterraneum]